MNKRNNVTSKPVLSVHYESRNPSAVRVAQIKYQERKVKPDLVVNAAIGNVSLPTNPVMSKRMFELNAPESPFSEGAIRYTETAGTDECRDAFKNILNCEDFDTSKMNIQITDGGSAAMELLIAGVCGPAGTDEKPLMLIDPAYTNYLAMTERVGRKTTTVKRALNEDGKFTLPKLEEIEKNIIKNKPGCLLVIPYDNPTGQLYDYKTMKNLARLCVKYNMWMASDEAYRELYYKKDAQLVSIWGVTDEDVPGIEGRRISIETASKVWNACGLRIGALITDSPEFNDSAIAEYTANLCANAIGQYIFGALAHESKEQILEWTQKVRDYYRGHIMKVYSRLKEIEPGLIVSSPDASIYSVIDVKNVVKPGFKAIDFVLYCAQEGFVILDGIKTTMLVAPMDGFYNIEEHKENPGDTQFRISFVESPENIAKIPELFIELLRQYEGQR